MHHTHQSTQVSGVSPVNGSTGRGTDLCSYQLETESCALAGILKVFVVFLIKGEVEAKVWYRGGVVPLALLKRNLHSNAEL